MTEIYLMGDDIGIIAGESGGILAYKPQNNLTPSESMRKEELEACVRGAPYTTIPYPTVREVLVEGQSIWRNRDCFPDVPAYQLHYGRGHVVIHMKSDTPNLALLVEKIIARGTGLRKSELEHIQIAIPRK